MKNKHSSINVKDYLTEFYDFVAPDVKCEIFSINSNSRVQFGLFRRIQKETVNGAAPIRNIQILEKTKTIKIYID